MRTYTLQSPKQIAERVVGKLLGGEGSGHHGHSGLENVHGGSSSKGGGGGNKDLIKKARKFRTSKDFINVYNQNRSKQRSVATQDIIKKNKEALDASVKGCARCTNFTLEAFGIRSDKPVIHGTGIIEALKKSGFTFTASDSEGTLDEFIKKHPKGNFYIMTSGHAMALIDGQLHDFSKGTGKRKVQASLEIFATGFENKTQAELIDIWNEAQKE